KHFCGNCLGLDVGTPRGTETGRTCSNPQGADCSPYEITGLRPSFLRRKVAKLAPTRLRPHFHDKAHEVLALPRPAPPPIEQRQLPRIVNRTGTRQPAFRRQADPDQRTSRAEFLTTMCVALLGCQGPRLHGSTQCRGLASRAAPGGG